MKASEVAQAMDFPPEDEGYPRLQLAVAIGLPAAWQLREKLELVLEGCGHDVEQLAEIFRGCPCGTSAGFWDALVWVVEVEDGKFGAREDWYQWCPDCRRLWGIATNGLT